MFNLNEYNNIKIYFADMPLYNEIELLIRKFDFSKTKEFFTYIKYALKLI